LLNGLFERPADGFPYSPGYIITEHVHYDANSQYPLPEFMVRGIGFGLAIHSGSISQSTIQVALDEAHESAENAPIRLARLAAIWTTWRRL
jgi:hypothetical protein